MTSIVISCGPRRQDIGRGRTVTLGSQRAQGSGAGGRCGGGKAARRGVKVTTFEDKTSTSQGQNLNTIVASHNNSRGMTSMSAFISMPI